MENNIIQFTVYRNIIVWSAHKMYLGYFENWAEAIKTIITLKSETILKIKVNNSIYLPR